MLEYKVCFHISYYAPWNVTDTKKQKQFHGKMHYCGATLEEAVDKVRGYVASLQVRNGDEGRSKCTSMWIMRGRDKGKNIKWDEYHKAGEPKIRWQNAIRKAQGRRAIAYAPNQREYVPY